MSKIFFIFVFSAISFLKADYLYVNNNQCVTQLEPFNSKGWCFIQTSNNQKICDKNAQLIDFINGFYFDGTCKMFDDLQKTGMTFSQFQFQQALLANLYAFFIFFLVGFLFVLQGRR